MLLLKVPGRPCGPGMALLSSKFWILRANISVSILYQDNVIESI
jgi:hypothetical protein